jgi:hypothetical protein
VIHFFGKLHIGNYWCYVGMALIVILAILTTLPVAINVHVRSEKVIDLWKRGLGKEPQVLYMRKKLEAVRPILHYGGINGYLFYLLQKSTLKTYFMTILDYTINLLLAF